MIDKEDLLNNKDFYKSFKNGEDLTSFFKEMHKRAVEHMLDAELDTHMDNEKHQKSITGNYRIIYTKPIAIALCFYLLYLLKVGDFCRRSVFLNRAIHFSPKG